MPNIQQGGGWFSSRRWRQVLGMRAPARVRWGAPRSWRCAQRSGLLSLACALMGVGTAQAQPTEAVLYNFCTQANCADGGASVAGLATDSAGNLYGTTLIGGGPSSCGGAPGCGAVFMLDTMGNYTVLYRFCAQPNCADGYSPYGGVILDSAGNLYGTTAWGGTGSYGNCFNGFNAGCGVMFELSADGNYTVLHNFCSLPGCADGVAPEGNLVLDSSGNLYGIASGGVSNYGTVFKLDTAGNHVVLYTFNEHAWWGDNGEPSLVLDPDGNLYGAAPYGGASSCHCGVVFKLSQTGDYQALYSFTGGADGANPVGGVILDSAGNLYGTTYYGGASGGGVVFELDAAGNYTALYNLSSASGRNPVGGLLLDSTGNLYGTTALGGANEIIGVVTGGGVVFELDTTGTYTILYSFPSVVPPPVLPGYFPQSNLISDSVGNLYGTTTYGGTGTGNGAGVVFELTIGLAPPTTSVASSSSP
jgi:uncharacterized repeat protein (TIGR03803 family)